MRLQRQRGKRELSGTKSGLSHRHLSLVHVPPHEGCAMNAGGISVGPVEAHMRRSEIQKRALLKCIFTASEGVEERNGAIREGTATVGQHKLIFLSYLVGQSMARRPLRSGG
jgi:hypothetical protein